MPETIQDALKWCEYILLANGPYREALNRVISYFITDVEILSKRGQPVGREEKLKYLDFLNDVIGIKTILHEVALDYLCYGNSFTSLLVPFRRYLMCPECHLELPLKKVYNSPDFGFHWSGFNFTARCPHCGYHGRWDHIDRRSGESDNIKVRRWSPHEIDILWDPYTGDSQIIWKIPEEYRNLVRRGHLHHLERASWEIIEAIQNNQNLMFDKDVVYHMKETTLSGVRNRGWGVSRVLTNFRQAWYVQVLHRYNEAIALDYVIPFRVITPMPRPGQGGEVNDPVLSINMGSFIGRVQEMLQLRRRDPARWNILPFPIDYKALGGDATQLAPKDLLDQGMSTLLNAVGIPVELYSGSLSLQSAPAALRLFEANWSHLIHNLNRFLNKLVEKIAQIMSWEPVNARLQRVTHADDLNRQMAKLQLMMGGQISRTTGLSTVGVDFNEETRRKLEEERIEAEATSDMQKEMQQSALMDEMAQPQDPSQQQQQGPMSGMTQPQQGQPQQGGGGDQGGGGGKFKMPTMQGMPGAMPGGGMPPVQQMGPMGVPMGPYGAMQSFMTGQPLVPNQPTTPEEMMQVADTLAQQLIMMPDSQCTSMLIRLKKENPIIHDLVKSKLEDMKRQAEAQGREQVLQQQYGKQAGVRTASEALALLKDAALRRRRELAVDPNYGKMARCIDLD